MWSYRYGGFEGIPASHILLSQRSDPKEKHGIPASHILLSQRPDPKEKQVINLDQDVQVCGYFLWMVYELLSMNYLSFFLLDRGYLFSFF